MSLALANRVEEKREASQVPNLSVWLLTNAPSPYQVELLSAIGRQREMTLAVRFMRPGSRAGQVDISSLNSAVMTGLGPRWFRDEIRLHPQAIRECAWGHYDCFVLSGLYTSITFLVCAVILTLRKKPWVLWLERPHPARPEAAPWSPRIVMSRPARWLRGLLQRWLLSHARRLLAIGSAAKEAYECLGMPSDRVEVLPYCCDVRRFDEVEPDQVARFRTRMGWAGKTVFLFSGQMIERKGVEILLEAFTRLANEVPQAQLVLLGDGPRRAQYEAYASPALTDRIQFAGHVPQSDLPLWFRSANVFVFPSRHDGWGVVINEACAARLPVVASRQTGATRDLVEEGSSGFLFECDDVDGFMRGMRHFVEHPQDCALFGERSRVLVESLSTQEGAAQFRSFIVRAVRGGSSGRFSLVPVTR